MEENKTSTWEEYRKRTHVIGRVVSAVTLVMLVGAPFLMGKILGAYPDLGAVARAFLSVGLVWLVSSVAEFLIYTPMLGSGGGYLAFITGNLINMKIPCAVMRVIWLEQRPEHRKMKSFLQFPLQPHPLLRFWFWQSESF